MSDYWSFKDYGSIIGPFDFLVFSIYLNNVFCFPYGTATHHFAEDNTLERSIQNPVKHVGWGF